MSIENDNTEKSEILQKIESLSARSKVNKKFKEFAHYERSAPLFYYFIKSLEIPIDIFLEFKETSCEIEEGGKIFYSKYLHILFVYLESNNKIIDIINIPNEVQGDFKKYIQTRCRKLNLTTFDNQETPTLSKKTIDKEFTKNLKISPTAQLANLLNTDRWILIDSTILQKRLKISLEDNCNAFFDPRLGRVILHAQQNNLVITIIRPPKDLRDALQKDLEKQPETKKPFWKRFFGK